MKMRIWLPGTMALALSVGIWGCKEEAQAKEGDQVSEVRQPGTNLFWLRCPLGQMWDGISCSGTEKTKNWYDAMKACPSGYRLPTRQELVGVLDGCDDGVRNDKFGSCKKCSESANCITMFRSEGSDNWSSSRPSSPDHSWMVSFYSGKVDEAKVDWDRTVLCVRSRP